MSFIKVTGGNRLYGDVRIHGCKNAVLPIIAATLLNGGVNVIHNCPRLSDVFSSVKILESLGASVCFENDTLTVDSSSVNCSAIGAELMKALRSSVVFLGALLSRCGRACVSMPGGCDIGTRPIDIHLTSFERMGVEVKCTDGEVECSVAQLHGEDIYLPFPSVGATENIILLSILGKGVTRIHNAAREPEIADLQAFLNSMGARVYGAGGCIITIYPVESLSDSEYTVMPDRIEASTFACAVAATGGRIYIDGIKPDYLASVLNVLRSGGAFVAEYPSGIFMSCLSGFRCPPIVSTGPYPGFPTDVQSLIMSVMSTSQGEGIIKENIFENRFGHAAELVKMGADISVSGSSAFIKGSELCGCSVCAQDLRSGAALVVASLAARGDSVIERAEYIDRGYDGFVNKLNSIGAAVERIE